MSRRFKKSRSGVWIIEVSVTEEVANVPDNF